MEISRISLKKIIIPALFITSGVAVTNNLCQRNDNNDKQNIEYMANNPATKAIEAGFFFGLFGKRKKENELLPSVNETKPVPEKLTPPDVSKLNLSEFNYPTIPEGAEYGTKIDFNIPEEATISYPDGTIKKLKDVMNDEGINTIGPMTSYVFIKDKNGNLFKYDSHSKKYCYFDLTTNDDTYYALSENNQLYSIDLEKLPADKAFAFNAQPITKCIIIPAGTKVNVGNNVIEFDKSSGGAYKKLVCYLKDGDTKFWTTEITKDNDVADNVSKQRQDTVLQYLKEEEKKLTEELNEQNRIEEKTRNMVVNNSYEKWGIDDDGRKKEVTSEENNFYKQVYDYYTNKNEKYKNYQFEFLRTNSRYTLKIKDGEKIVETIYGRRETIDGPIFSSSRIQHRLGEFTAIYPSS